MTATSGSAIVIAATSNPAFAAMTSNSGSFATAQSTTMSGPLANSGTLSVTGSAILQAANYSQSAGSTTVGAGATLKSGSTGTAAVTINGGTVTGTGTVQGAVNNAAGTVVPGTSGTGTLTATGSFAQGASGTLSVTATSTTLAASGAVTVGGTLAIVTPSPTPALGTVATVLSGASLTGTFASIIGQDVPAAGGYWSVAYSGTAVTLTLTPYPSVSVSGGSVTEGNSGTSSLPFTLTLSAASQQTVTVQYATSDGSATAGTDYTAASGTATFAPGTITKTVNVSVNGDALYEHDETVLMAISTPASATLGTANAAGTISNDDAQPSLSIGDAGATVSSASGAPVSFPVTLSAVSGVDASASYTTSDGSAIAGTDYTASSGTVTIPAGSTTGTVTVQALPQSAYASPKTFTITLSAPVDATLGTSTATGTITNDNASVTSVSQPVVFRPSSTSETITGVNFAPGSTVSVSGTKVTVSNVVVTDSHTITATFAVNSAAAVGPRSVIVTSPGHGAATCTNCLAVHNRPTVTSVSPSVLPRNTATPQSLTVTGVNFVGGARVSFVPSAGMVVTPGSTHVVSSTTITLTVKAQQTAALGAHDVRVTNPDTGISTCAGCLTVEGPAVNAASPNTVPRGQPTSVTITGSAFDPAATVTVGCPASGTTIVNDTTITLTMTCAPSTTLGAKSIVVTNPDGGAFTCTACLTVFGPNITGVSPASVARGHSAALTISGNNFVTGATLSAGPCTFSGTVVVGPHSITTTISCPAGAPIRRPVDHRDQSSFGGIGCRVLRGVQHHCLIDQVQAIRGATSRACAPRRRGTGRCERSTRRPNRAACRGTRHGRARRRRAVSRPRPG